MENKPELFFRLALGCYLGSLILPSELGWFTGAKLAVSTIFLSSIALFSSPVGTFHNPNGWANLTVVLTPFFNMVFVLCAAKFRSYQQPRILIRNWLLFLSCPIAAIWMGYVISLMKLDVAKSKLLPLSVLLVLWTLSLILLAIATILKLKKNLAAE